jgi:hypothetical protein
LFNFFGIYLMVSGEQEPLFDRPFDYRPASDDETGSKIKQVW